jgi:hypothetical protein
MNLEIILSEMSDSEKQTSYVFSHRQNIGLETNKPTKKRHDHTRGTIWEGLSGGRGSKERVMRVKYS